jgi:hypothetical protein
MLLLLLCPVLLSADTKEVRQLATWIAKHGLLLGSFEMDMRHPTSVISGLDEAGRAAAFAALGNALRLAAATPQGLRLRSCKLEDADWDCARILQQLPGHTLTSLDLQLDLTGPHDADECVRRLAGVRAALPQLQQLRKLALKVDCFHSRCNNDDHLKYVDPLLLQPGVQPLLGLTNLTSLMLNSLWSVG